jgi:hypothetical protein
MCDRQTHRVRYSWNNWSLQAIPETWLGTRGNSLNFGCSSSRRWEAMHRSAIARSMCDTNVGRYWPVHMPVGKVNQRGRACWGDPKATDTKRMRPPGLTASSRHTRGPQLEVMVPLRLSPSARQPSDVAHSLPKSPIVTRELLWPADKLKKQLLEPFTAAALVHDISSINGEFGTNKLWRRNGLTGLLRNEHKRRMTEEFSLLRSIVSFLLQQRSMASDCIARGTSHAIMDFPFRHLGPQRRPCQVLSTSLDGTSEP